MLLPIFSIVNTSAAVIALLGPAPVRVYAFGLAPQRVGTPYATWQIISGSPENYLGSLPDVDAYSVQFDVWADSELSVLSAAQALRNAIEPRAHITAWGNAAQDSQTKLYRYTFSADFIVQR